MAVKCEFINVILNLEAVDKKYPGGRKGFLKDFKDRLGKIDWYDDYLYRTGAMSPNDTMEVVKYLQTLGFEGIQKRYDGKEVWSDDICVVDTITGETLPCSWIIYDDEKQEASHIKEGNNALNLLQKYIHERVLEITFHKEEGRMTEPYLKLYLEGIKKNTPNAFNKIVYGIYSLLLLPHFLLVISVISAWYTNAYYFFGVMAFQLLLHHELLGFVGKKLISMKMMASEKMFEIYLDDPRIHIVTKEKTKDKLGREKENVVLWSSSSWKDELQKAIYYNNLPKLK